MTSSESMSSSSDAIGFFERYLSVWVAICIGTGIVAGSLYPPVFEAISKFEYASVNLFVAILIWLMIFPMMVNVEFSSLKDVGRRPKGIVITLVVNWLIKPFSMAALGVLFFEVLFADFINPQDAQEYIAGLILLGAAPCTAMVFVWSQMTKGDANFTVVQVSLNDLIMVVAFAPIVALLLGVTDIIVPWETLVLSVVMYVVVPIFAGALVRRRLMRNSGDNFQNSIGRLSERMKPFSVFGLLATVFLLFAFQSPTILAAPEVIGMIAVPLLIQSYGIFALAYLAAWLWRVPHSVAAPSAMIGTSNFFELAVAVAIGMFGLGSGAALATVVGVLVEVPVMLSLVAFANATKPKFEFTS